jgi:aryl-alcohol dehydrogenase-like predicted oxidoreductase
MRTRPLGKTGIEVSEIGLGGWGIGGSSGDASGYGPTDDAVSRSVLRQALESGVTFYDTSPVYGYGRSEELIGEVFEGVREKVVLATKVGFVDSSGAQDFSPEHVARSLEESLKRLRTDHVDLYQMHDPPFGLLERDARILKALHSLKREGKVRALGITVRSPADAFRAVERFGFECVQVNFNLLDQRVLETGLLDFCRSREVGVIIRTPLCFGFLTGAYAAEGPFEPTDHRSRWSLEQRALWVEGYRLFQSVLAQEKQTPAQMALRFCISHPAVSTVIPGMMQPEHVLEDAQASAMGSLAPAQMEMLQEIYQGKRFFIKDRLVLSE